MHTEMETPLIEKMYWLRIVESQPVHFCKFSGTHFATQISQNWWHLPLFTTRSMRPEGGWGEGLGQAVKPRPKGCSPLPLPGGQAKPHFWQAGKVGKMYQYIFPNLKKCTGRELSILSRYIFPKLLPIQ